MIKVKFLHCADIHLDAPFTALGGDGVKSSVRRQELRDTFRKIVQMADRESVDFLFISGDLYEHDYVKKSTIHTINQLFMQIPNVKVILVPGNHDPYIANSFYKNYSWSGNVYVLCSDNPNIQFQDMQVCIYGIGFSNFFEDKPLTYDIQPFNPELVNILLLHGTVDISIKNNTYNTTTSENLKSLNMDYIALGHFHNRIDNLGGHGMIYNPGSPEPLGFDEEGEHGIYLGTISKEPGMASTLEVNFIQTAQRFYANMDVNVQGANSEMQVIGRIEEELAERGGMDTRGLYAVTLKGQVESGFTIDLDAVAAAFQEKAYHLKLKDETTGDYCLETLLQEPGLKGLFARKIFAKMEITEDAYEKEMLRKALHYGLEALEKGKVEI